MKLQKQEYEQKPMTINDVRGQSSKAIFEFMITQSKYLDMNEFLYRYPIDVDDWVYAIASTLNTNGFNRWYFEGKK